ncbi:MAG: AbrB/MazE/SpoVT family DNA-binding domain-containing protein [Rhizobiaceae bacterium]
MPVIDTHRNPKGGSPAEKLKRMLESMSSHQLHRALRELPESQLKQALNAKNHGMLNSKSAKIRLLAQAGFSTSNIADLLGIRYQHAYNVIKSDKDGSRGRVTPARTRNTETITEKITIGAAGRIVIPAEIRDRLGVKEGDELTLQFRDGQLVVHSRKTALAKARALVRKYVPEDQSLADELIAERRAEAAMEGGE